jgi:hypothetical protein
MKNQDANVEMITMAIIAAVMFAISVPIIFNVVGSVDIATIDTDLQASMGEGTSYTPAANATDNLLTQVNSFFSIGPKSLGQGSHALVA